MSSPPPGPDNSPHLHPVDDEAEYDFREGCRILELLNTPDSPDSSIARATVAPGEATRWHRLRGIRERYVILSGTGRVEVGDTLVSTVGMMDTVDIPADVPQRIANTGREPLVFLCICTPRFVPDAYIDVEPD